jgi:ribosome-associated toxin RatA of RatAB toxin-antitoxin module
MMNVFVKDIRKYHEFLTSKEGTKVIAEPKEQSWGGIQASTEL